MEKLAKEYAEAMLTINIRDPPSLIACFPDLPHLRPQLYSSQNYLRIGFIRRFPAGKRQ